MIAAEIQPLTIAAAVFLVFLGLAAGLFIGWLHWGDDHRGYVIGRGDKDSGWLHDGWVCVPSYRFDPERDHAAYMRVPADVVVHQDPDAQG